MIKKTDFTNNKDYDFLVAGQQIRRSRKLKYAFLNRHVQAEANRLENDLTTIEQHLQIVRHFIPQFADIHEADQDNIDVNGKLFNTDIFKGTMLLR